MDKISFSKSDIFSIYKKYFLKFFDMSRESFFDTINNFYLEESDYVIAKYLAMSDVFMLRNNISIGILNIQEYDNTEHNMFFKTSESVNKDVENFRNNMGEIEPLKQILEIREFNKAFNKQVFGF